MSDAWYLQTTFSSRNHIFPDTILSTFFLQVYKLIKQAPLKSIICERKPWDVFNLLLTVHICLLQTKTKKIKVLDRNQISIIDKKPPILLIFISSFLFLFSVSIMNFTQLYIFMNKYIIKRMFSSTS